MPGDYSEDTLIERPTIDLFSDLHWKTANCYNEFQPGAVSQGRETSAEVVLVPRLRAALEQLNPGVPADAIGLAIEELVKAAAQ